PDSVDDRFASAAAQVRSHRVSRVTDQDGIPANSAEQTAGDMDPVDECLFRSGGSDGSLHLRWKPPGGAPKMEEPLAGVLEASFGKCREPVRAVLRDWCDAEQLPVPPVFGRLTARQVAVDHTADDCR